MAECKHWKVDIYIDEHDRTTRAEARLHNRDNTTLHGAGTAKCHPHDRNIPEIGDELAAARALSDLAHRLVEAAVGDIEQITHQPSRLEA